MTPQRPYLVVFRAGAHSLHPRIVAEDPSRNWDCVVNWWGVEPDHASADVVLPGGINKPDGFYHLATQDLIAWRSYDYIMLLDDDVYFSPGDISRLFTMAQEHATYLAQPALRWGTYASHSVTLWNPLCKLRATSFVEVMAPVFSRAALEYLLETLTLTKSTWGIDWAWSALLANQQRIHVIDAVRVDHTKPVNLKAGPLYQLSRSLGTDARSELEAIKRRFPTFGGIGTHRDGHTFRACIPQWAGFWLIRLNDKAIRYAHARGWSSALPRRP